MGCVVYRRISFADLEKGLGITIHVNKDNHGRLVVSKKQEKEILDALYFLGVKNNQHLELEEKSEHVKIDGKRVFNYSFVGEERSDKKWLMSGFASEEALLNSSKMKDMVNIAQQLRRGGV